MSFVTLNNITLHYQLGGLQDGVPLVFINSLGSDLRIWDDVAAHFGATYPTVRHDKRGHGLSDAPDGPYTMADHSADVEHLLDHLGFEHAILVGVSVGGMIALQFAVSHPARVKALILFDTAAKIGSAEFWQTRIDTIKEHGLDHVAEAILSRWFAPDFVEMRSAEYRGYLNLFKRNSLVGYTGTCAALGSCDLRDAVTSIQQPALVLCGAEDTATTPELVRGLADSLPNARFALIENAGHTPSVENPQRTIELMQQFLETL